MNVFAAAAEAWRTGRRAAFVTVIGVGGSTPRSSGARMLVHADGTIVGTIGGGAIEHRVIDQALEAIRRGRPERLEADLTRDLGMCCGGRMEVYVEPLQVRVPMVVFGAGHVAVAATPLRSTSTSPSSTSARTSRPPSASRAARSTAATPSPSRAVSPRIPTPTG